MSDSLQHIHKQSNTHQAAAMHTGNAARSLPAVGVLQPQTEEKKEVAQTAPDSIQLIKADGGVIDPPATPANSNAGSFPSANNVFSNTAVSVSPVQTFKENIHAPQVESNQPAAFKPVQEKQNQTGIPDGLKEGVEGLSGLAMDDVKVHYNSAQPAQLKALAYAQGNEIHIGPGQEKHLPHEAWHVVQQKQGKVAATGTVSNGIGINDNPSLEQEASSKGAEAAQFKTISGSVQPVKNMPAPFNPPVQRLMGIEAELSVPVSTAMGGADEDARIRNFLSNGAPYKGGIAGPANGYKKTVDHDQLGTAIKKYHGVFDGLLKAAGKAPLAPYSAQEHGNMEYVTDNGAVPPAYDEETDAGLKDFRASIKHMAGDMNTVINDSKNGLTPAGGGLQYGLPALDEWKEFGKANGLDAATVNTAHALLRVGINDQLYVQVTAGVTPNKIAAHLKRVGADHRMATLKPNFAKEADATAYVGLLTTRAVTAAENAINTVNANMPAGTAPLARDIVRSSSLKGYVALIMSYIFGFYMTLRRGGGALGKNAVPLLSKVPLHEIQLEMDITKRPDSWLAKQRATLETRIIASALNELNAAPVKRAAGDDADVDILFPIKWKTAWVGQVLNGNAGGSDAFFKDQNLTAIAPSDHATSDAIKTGAGRAIRNKAPKAKEKGGAIPMEIRMMQERPTPNGLLELVNHSITHVRKVHGHWLG